MGLAALLLLDGYAREGDFLLYRLAQICTPDMVWSAMRASEACW
jgi:hypothetical protein